MKDDPQNGERAADATYENEKINMVKETDDMVLLIEQHKKEIWDYQQKESQWVRDQNQLEGSKRIIQELSTKFNDMDGRLQSALDINDNHQRYNGKLQTRLTEVEDDNKKLAQQIQDLTRRKFGEGTY